MTQRRDPCALFLQGACRQLPHVQTAPLSRHDHPAFLRGCVAYNTNAHPWPITWNCTLGFSPTIQPCPVSRLSTTIINHQLQQHSRFLFLFPIFSLFLCFFSQFFCHFNVISHQKWVLSTHSKLYGCPTCITPPATHLFHYNQTPALASLLIQQTFGA